MAVSQGDSWWTWLTGGAPSGGDAGGGGGESLPTGTPYEWYLAGGQGGYPGQAGYYGSGGGSGYIHGGPEADANAWRIYTEMRRNGWEVPNPYSLTEARRGMGQFTEEQWREYYENFIKSQQPNLSTNDFEQNPNGFANPNEPAAGEFDPGVNPPLDFGAANKWMLRAINRTRLGKWGLDDWLKNLQNGTTGDMWMDQMNDDQSQWLNDWMIGLGADKNWQDRLAQGDAPWSRGQDVIDMTGRQDPRAEPGVRDPAPIPGRRNPPGGGPGGEGDGGGGYTGPGGIPAYAGVQHTPTFMAWQPYNTNGVIQFVPGRR